MISPSLRLAIDIGGTFTDTVLLSGQSDILATAKTPTTPDIPTLGALDGARDVLASAGRDWNQITGFIHGTTLATNALIERRGAQVATITTQGFRDILEIAYERRHSQYALNIKKPDLIVPRAHALTIDERVDARGLILRPLAEDQVDHLAAQLQDAGIEAVAICLLHAYANPTHELRLKELLAAQLPELVISLSHEVSPEAREFDRLCTSIANAYIQPLMARYLADFEIRFRQAGLICPILMMTAGGGMTTLDTASRLPIRLVESGPAGGAILAARVAREISAPEVLSFDMGGTTAKLCLIDQFTPQTARSFEIARAERFVKGSGMPVRIPVVEMIEIGAGGGSLARVDRIGRVQIGPESAGSDPGPAGFARGGMRPTVTDGDIRQGLIDPDHFAEGRLQIDPALSDKALMDHIGVPLGLDSASAAAAISDIVDENMASAGRMHAVESGKDLSTRVMIAFGGNGPLHASRVARRARVRQIVIPRAPGVGSAIGFLFAPVSFDVIRSRYTTLEDPDLDGLNRFLGQMQQEAEAVVIQGAPDQPLLRSRRAFMRYHGQGHEIEVPLPEQDLTKDDLPRMIAAFEQEYARQFSRVVPGMRIECLNWAVSVASPSDDVAALPPDPAPYPAKPQATRTILCDVTRSWREAAVYERASLAPGGELHGPALIIEAQTTSIVSADFTARVDALGNIWMTQTAEPAP